MKDQPTPQPIESVSEAAHKEAISKYPIKDDSLAGPVENESQLFRQRAKHLVFIRGAEFGAQWQARQGWVDVNKVVEILEAARISAVKNKSHAGDYAEAVLYDIIQEVEALPLPPNQTTK